MAIADWPVSERPREKLLLQGPRALSDAELLALLLGTGSGSLTALDVARQLLQEFGSLAGLLRANNEQLLASPGLGSAKIARLRAVPELAHRALLSGLQRGEALTNPPRCRRYLQTLLGHESHEVFWALLLDNQHRVLHSLQLASGTLDSATVYPREVVVTCLRHQAAAVIFAHNHPSGSLEPSLADRDITNKLKAALNSVEIRLLDHFIVSDRGCASMAELGLV